MAMSDMEILSIDPVGANVGAMGVSVGETDDGIVGTPVGTGVGARVGAGVGAEVWVGDAALGVGKTVG